MDVWFTWSKRTAQCCWCHRPIHVATPMVMKRLWRKGNPESRKINLTFYYHPQCHMDSGMDYLNTHPYTPGLKRGPKESTLTEEQRRTRYLLLRRKASLEQRRRKLKAEYPDRILLEANIDQKIADLMVEIAKVGGIPASWVSKMQTRST